MRLGIIGSGNVARALGGAWQRHNHQVTYGVRNPESGNARKAAASDGAIASIADATRAADVVVIATPFGAAQAALADAGDLAGRTLVDCTNPLTPDFSDLSIGFSTSAAEQIAGWAPGAHVVKAFNTLGAQHLGNPRIGEHTASMMYCGDDAAAKQVVASLGRDIGFDMVDAGALRRARLIEPLAMLWISLAYAQGLGPDVAFRLVRAS